MPGAPGILGSVDKASYESISEDFAIGADRYGRAVFKDPRKAFDTFAELYAEGIALIREENDLPDISETKYSAYKKLGWQTTSGSKEARDQAAFVSKFLDIYENSFTNDVPAPNTEIPTADTAQPRARKWFDDTSDLYQTGEIALELPEIPGVTFRATAEAITANEATVIQGMPICSAYFWDLTGDGVPELCANIYLGSGMIDSRVIVYDYARGMSYELEDRGYYDYYLRMNEADGCLYTDQCAYMEEKVLASGKLVLRNGALQIAGQTSVSVFQAKILEVWDNCYLVEPVEGSGELSSSDRIVVPMKNMAPSPEPMVGDTIEISYDGLLMESGPAQIWQVYSIRVVRQAKEANRYYFTVGEEGVCSVVYSGRLFSGGCQKADGSAFRPAETVWLEGLDGLADLRGITVNALDEHGHMIWGISIADTEENRGITEASAGLWMIRPEK